MKKNTHFIIAIYTLLMFFNVSLFGQVSNDLCETAIKIPDPRNWCSSKGEFSNIGATDSQYSDANCWTAGATNDVWFSFIARATDIRITINGKANVASGGSLDRPQAALYYGSCGGTVNELECNQASSSSNIIELYQGGLFVGGEYYIRVDGFEGNVGTFQICTNNYNPPANASSDCSDGAILCDKSSFVIESVVGAGNNANEIPSGSCFDGGIGGVGTEFNSVWVKWTCDEPGSLTMILTPTSEVDDLDFIVFELPNGIDDCSDKEILRCMAAGADVADYPTPCHGPTGMSFDAKDISESPGCGGGNNNWISPINMEKGKSYALIVNNFTAADHGFNVEWGGTGTFLGPVANFGFNPPEIKCLETVQISDSSSFANGNIVSWEWYFGEDADPQTGSGQGPFDVTYNSFGVKSVVLTVESDEGCLITKVIEYNVLECCSPDVDNLRVNLLDVQDVVCFGDSTGIVEIKGEQGNPWYKFSIDDTIYQFGTTFSHLPAGDYIINAYDRLGCLAEIPVTVGTPPPLIIDAGPDITVDLGYEAQLNSTLSPSGRPVEYMWSPDTLMVCSNCPSTEIIPPGKTTYTIDIIDEDGCVAQDKVTVFVNDKRPIHIPNVFHPDYDGINDYFTIYGERAAVRIASLNVFDRWGNLVFKGIDLPLGVAREGWDGTVSGKDAEQGVYTYYAEVLFVDGVKLLYSGDITLLR